MADACEHQSDESDEEAGDRLFAARAIDGDRRVLDGDATARVFADFEQVREIARVTTAVAQGGPSSSR